MKLPNFKYHPDPFATGAVVASTAQCKGCNQARGFIYQGPVCAVDELDDCLCPWCVSDGTAHKKLDASFVDEAGVGGYGEWEAVPRDVVEEIAYRTPCFTGWQQENWWTHCKDGAEYIGRFGKAELQGLGQQAIDAIRDSTGMDAGADWELFFDALDRDGSPTAYLFRCRHCGLLGGYQDCD